MISVILSLNIIVMHVTKIFFFAKLVMLITTIGLITIGQACWIPYLGLKLF